MRISTIFGTKMAHLSWTKTFCHKPLLLLSSTFCPFSLCKIKKNSYSGSRIMTMHHFWVQNGQFAPPPSATPKIYFLENYYYHSHLSISFFHCAKFKKSSSSRSRVMRLCNFWAQNGPFPHMKTFSGKLFISLVSFIHAYLHAKNQSQILIY